MSAWTAFATGANALFRRDLSIFVSYRGRLLMRLTTGFVSVALFYYISRLVSVRQFASPDEYFAFVVVGIAITEVVVSTLGVLPSRISQELYAGTFERLVLSPLGAVAGIVSMTMFPLLLAYLTAVTSIAFAAVVFGVALHWETVPLAVPAAALASIAFVPFSIFVCAAMMIFKQAASLAGLITTGLSFIAGFLFPIALLPDWIRWASEAQPFTPAVELLRKLLVDTPMTQSSEAAAVAKLAAFAIALFPVALFALHAAVRHAQKKGTVTEY
jgi:ABC-2 type transport system permease protein